jgi:hypothetical protein
MTMFHASSADSPGSTSLSLLRSAIADQPEAWEKLAHLYFPLVYITPATMIIIESQVQLRIEYTGLQSNS